MSQSEESLSSGESVFESGGRGLELARDEIQAAEAVSSAAEQTVKDQVQAQEQLENYFNGKVRDCFPDRTDGYFNPRSRWETLRVNVVERLTGERSWWQQTWGQFIEDERKFSQERLGDVREHLTDDRIPNEQRVSELFEVRNWVENLRQFPVDFNSRFAGPDGLRANLLGEVSVMDRNLQVLIGETRSANHQHPDLQLMIDTWHSVQDFQNRLADWLDQSNGRVKAFDENAAYPAGRVGATFGEVEYLYEQGKKIK